LHPLKKNQFNPNFNFESNQIGSKPDLNFKNQIESLNQSKQIKFN